VRSSRRPPSSAAMRLMMAGSVRAGGGDRLLLERLDAHADRLGVGADHRLAREEDESLGAQPLDFGLEGFGDGAHSLGELVAQLEVLLLERRHHLLADRVRARRLVCGDVRDQASPPAGAVPLLLGADALVRGVAAAGRRLAAVGTHLMYVRRWA